MGIFIAIIAGAGLGYILERGDFCFHSTLRGLFRVPPQRNLFRAYLLTLLIAIPLVQLMRGLGWINPWVAPLAWQANIVGGVIFGVGMVIAATCVTGLFYKLGHGMLGTLVGMTTWFIGDIITYRGPLNPLRTMLNQSVITIDNNSATVSNLLGSTMAIGVLVLLGIAAVWFFWRSPRPISTAYWHWLVLGLATGLFTSFAWLLARWGGADYAYGTSGVPTSLFTLVVDGTPTHYWIPVTLFSIIPGALIAAWLAGTLWVRGETMTRYTALAVGGLLMGVGAAISGGCNLGHSLVGVPLLSLGSIVTTLSMALGVFLADRTLKLRVKTDLQPEPAHTSA